MKLLYVWIEEFRNIVRQGFIVDNEYLVTVNSLTSNSESDKVVSLNIAKNHTNASSLNNSPIRSITALTGENASGKSSILECLYTQGHRFSQSQRRRFLLVFLNDYEHCIEIRAKNILVTGNNIVKAFCPQKAEYEKYIFPFENYIPSYPKESEDITHLFSLCTMKNIGTYSGYSVMGLPTIVGNLDAFDTRNAFQGAFKFLCDFPDLGGHDNKLAIFLQDESAYRSPDYFFDRQFDSEQYKQYFIYKLAHLIFSNLRDYLYHPTPMYAADGTRIQEWDENLLQEEDLKCMDILSFSNIFFPEANSDSLLSMYKVDIPVEEIRNALIFFESSTFFRAGKKAFLDFIVCLKQLFEELFNLDNKLFTALYKLEIPFESQFLPCITAFQNCISADLLNGNWTENIHISFEWFSSGEFHIAMLFSAIYQRITEVIYDGIEQRDVILLLDEPEMHMHPETGRHFIANLTHALTLFKTKGLVNQCQIILSTHSPFIVQELSGYPHSLTLVKKNYCGYITIQDFYKLDQLVFPNRAHYSFNLIMFHIFGIPTIELHNELYGILQDINGLYNIMNHKDPKTKQIVDGIDAWLKASITPSDLVIKHWIPKTKGTVRPAEAVTLQTYIRNSIHHPENQENSSFSASELRLSIEQMLTLLPP